MSRFENSPGLFGRGVGSATSGNTYCQWCGIEHKNREYKSGEPYPDNDSIGLADFGDLQVLDCCFEKV